MERNRNNAIRWLFGFRDGPLCRLVPRWIFLRAFAAIDFSAFNSLLFQIEELIGPRGIHPVQPYLAAVARSPNERHSRRDTHPGPCGAFQE